MNQTSHTLAHLALACTTALCLTSAQADETSPWAARIGATQITPHTHSGDLSAPSFAGTRIDVGSSARLTGGITYFINDQLSVDVPLSTPFKFEVKGAGAIGGVGKLGDSKALPATALLQYRFGQAGQFLRPYVGAGATYAYFYNQRSTAALSALTGGSPGNATSLKVDSKLAATVQAGLNIDLGNRWYADAAVLRTFLSTKGHLSTGQTIDLRLDPTTVTVGVGRRF